MFDNYLDVSLNRCDYHQVGDLFYDDIKVQIPVMYAIVLDSTTLVSAPINCELL